MNRIIESQNIGIAFEKKKNTDPTIRKHSLYALTTPGCVNTLKNVSQLGTSKRMRKMKINMPNKKKRFEKGRGKNEKKTKNPRRKKRKFVNEKPMNSSINCEW